MNEFAKRRQEQLRDDGYVEGTIYMTKEMLEHTPEEGEWVKTNQGWTMVFGEKKSD